MIINLFPSYGRTYSSAEQALADWNAGKDFNIYRGPYTSIRDSARLEAQGLYRAQLWNGRTNPRPLATIALHQI